MSGRRGIQVAVLVVAAVVGSVTTIALWGGRTSSAHTSPERLATAEVVRTNLTTSELTEGTLGYEPTSPVVNLLTGTYTALPSPSAVILPGGVLYRVDNQPVVLMSGATPAWRTFALGMIDGPDVAELESNLISLGYARGLFTSPNDHFSSLTATAVGRWQVANGYPSTGQLALGQVVFESAPVRVGAENVAPGQPATPGDLPYQVTTTTRVVSVPLGASAPPVSVGEGVSIVLPSGATTPGRVSAVGPAPAAAATSQGTSGTAGSSSGSTGSSGSVSGQSSASSVATVTPDDPSVTGDATGIAVQVSLTSQSASNVLAVPIPALLALAEGGYGLEVVTPSGHHNLIQVTTGIFTGSQVQVSGPGIEAGTKVVVAQ
jgi:hypothetical protein